MPWEVISMLLRFLKAACAGAMIALATAGHESDATIRLDTQVLPCRTESAGDRTQIVLAQEIVLAAGQRLEIQTSRRAK